VQHILKNFVALRADDLLRAAARSSVSAGPMRGGRRAEKPSVFGRLRGSRSFAEASKAAECAVLFRPALLCRMVLRHAR
jgi:hypothetical protein